MKEVKREKRHWDVRSVDGKTEISLNPVFYISAPENGDVDVEQKEIECRFIEIEIKHEGKVVHSFTMNYLDYFMFAYMTANEELRQQLQMRYERKAGSIPYEVTFSLSPEEKTSGVAKRLITLTVDEITMAIARSEARLLSGKMTPETLETYVARKTGKTGNMRDPGHYTHKKQ
jgi:hypothetical protein